jgi:hypothetical protein
MATVRISEAEAARDFPGLLARVRAGAEIIIEDPATIGVVMRPAAEPVLRRLSESLRIARELGSTATLDGGFGNDLEAAVKSHPEALENLWD